MSKKHVFKELIARAVSDQNYIHILQWIKNGITARYFGPRPKEEKIASFIKEIETLRKKRKEFRIRKSSDIVSIYKHKKEAVLPVFDKDELDENDRKAILKYLLLRREHLKDTPESFYPPYYFDIDSYRIIVTSVRHTLVTKIANSIIIKQTVYKRKRWLFFPGKKRNTYYELTRTGKNILTFKEIPADEANRKKLKGGKT